jgi:hypothetical protein
MASVERMAVRGLEGSISAGAKPMSYEKDLGFEEKV